ncbi:MAG: GNAT family N-acetyltransferase [Alphaproteobacteria bacterium]|nr:MAG: GNAT family N-acetyltransferase [Alphaproteobacteria bacterium]
MITYQKNCSLTTDDIIRVFHTSGIKRPIDDHDRITTMFAHANLVISAWHDARLIGIARALTDYSYCCYLSDLAVDKEYHHQGVGSELIAHVRQNISEQTSLLLVSAPSAIDYYPKVGFSPLEHGFIIKRLA